MRTTAIVCAAVLLAGSSTALAGPENRRNPYGSLFTAQLPGVPNRPAAPPVQPPALATTVAPQLAQKIVCGMAVQQGDAKIDPAMPRHVPPGAPAGTIRTIEPQICR